MLRTPRPLRRGALVDARCTGCSNALAFWLGFRAVGIDAPFSAALFLQGIIAIGVAVPQAPGFFGVFEASREVGLAASTACRPDAAVDAGRSAFTC